MAKSVHEEHWDPGEASLCPAFYHDVAFETDMRKHTKKKHMKKKH